MDTAQWIQNNKKVCFCNAITHKTVVEAIDNGAKTVGDVNRKTGCGSGGCKGARCSPTIDTLLEERKK